MSTHSKAGCGGMCLQSRSAGMDTGGSLGTADNAA